ncbi:hypothetical protein KAR91_23190 [Candidatus Pacearchaeota archaeon]|nr:hypothetical protein [Candidatus Pacearchaeota archaeon]
MNKVLMLAIVIVVSAAILILGIPALKNLLEPGHKIASGIVVGVEIKIEPGAFLRSAGALSVVTFKDGRVLVFNNAIQMIHLNRCNEFWQSFWHEIISARPCEAEGGPNAT